MSEETFWQYSVRLPLRTRLRVDALTAHVGQKYGLHNPKRADVFRAALFAGLDLLEEEQAKEERAAAARARRAKNGD